MPAAEIETPEDAEALRVRVRSLAAAGANVWTEASGQPPGPGTFLRHPPPRAPVLDTRSGLVRADAGLDLAGLERFLGDRGHTLGATPGPPPPVPVGTWLEMGGRGLPWPAALGLASRVVRFRALLAGGDAVEDGRAPRSAAGPDLRALWIGARGAFGVLLDVELSVHRIGARHEVWTLQADPVRLAAIARAAAASKGPADGIWLVGPDRLVYLAHGEPELVAARVRGLGPAAERVDGNAPLPFERIASWTPDDPDRGVVPRAAERAVPFDEVPRALAGGDLVAVESPRRFRAFSAPGPVELPDPRPPAGPLARFLAGLDPEGRWNR